MTIMMAGMWGQTPHVPPMDTIIGKEETYLYNPNYWRLVSPCYFYPIYHPIFPPGNNYIDAMSIRYESDTVVKIIGLAVAGRYNPVGGIGHSNLNMFLMKHHPDGRVEKLAEGSVDVRSVSRWMEINWTRLRFEGIDRGWFYTPVTKIIPIQEVYFEKPISVTDSFYVGFEMGTFQGSDGRQICLWETAPTPESSPGCVGRGGIGTLPSGGEWLFQSVPYECCSFIFFPIQDSTGWYLKCDTMVCPEVEEIELSTAGGIAVLRWTGDTVQCNRWQVSYGPEGIRPGEGRVLNCNTTHTVLYNTVDTVRYVAYVRSYCPECKKWSSWSEGIAVYTGQEPIGVAEAEATGVELEPNPARGRVVVKSESEMAGLRVYNVQGLEVKRLRVTGRQAEIDVRGWPAGVYRVTVYGRAGAVSRNLVVE